MGKSYLSVIIPTHNDNENLPITLIEIDKHLENLSFDYEILVVDCYSKDNTVEIARKFEGIIPNLRVLESNGTDNAINMAAGFSAASGKYRLVVRADNSISIDTFLDMIPYLEGKDGIFYDVLIGSRLIPRSESKKPIKIWEKIFLWFQGNIIKFFLLKGINDAASGFVCFSENLSEKINSAMISSGSVLEMIFLARLSGSSIKEIPVSFTNKSQFKKEVADTLGYVKEAFKIKFRQVFKKPIGFK